jgi:hypothetical protein
MICHAGPSVIAAEQVKRMSDRQPEPEQGSADTAPPHTTERDGHWSYLLRLWRAGADSGWRASLQSIPGGERRLFADPNSLLAFLLGHAWTPPGRVARDHPDEISSD